MWTKNVFSLYLDHSNATDDSLRKIGVLRNLGTLDISYNPLITKACLRDLIKLQNLRTLYVSGIPMDEEFLLGLAKIPKLVCLSMYDTDVTSSMLAKFYRLRPDISVYK